MIPLPLPRPRTTGAVRRCTACGRWIRTGVDRKAGQGGAMSNRCAGCYVPATGTHVKPAMDLLAWCGIAPAADTEAQAA